MEKNEKPQITVEKKVPSKDSKDIKQYIIEIIIQFVFWIIPAPAIIKLAKNFISTNLKWIFIILFICIYVWLIFRLWKKPGILYEDTKDKIKFNRFGIAIIALLLFIDFLLFIPPMSDYIVKLVFNTQSQEGIEINETPQVVNTYSTCPKVPPNESTTPSPSQTPTPEFTSGPLPTTEYAETPTPFTPVDEFANSCIPSDWKIYPEYLITLDKININEDCLKLDKLGFKALTQGLQVLATTDEDKGSETAGIYRSLPSDNFRLNIVFKDLELNSPNQNGSILYIMFINSQDALSIENISNFGKLFVFNKYFLLYNNYENTYSSEYYYFKPDIEYLLTCDKFGLSLACGLKGLDKEPDFPEIEFNPDWDSVFIGYYLSGDSSVKINITQFHFIPIEP